MSEALDEAARTEALDNAPGREHFIYSIFCQKNQKCYIGQTVDTKQRWYTHKSNLMTKKHWCKELQQDWDAYGKNWFSLFILESGLFSQEAADSAERKFILANQNSYNYLIVNDESTGKLTATPLLRKRQSESLKRSWNNPDSSLRSPARTRWDDPNQKNIQSKAMKEHYSDPAERLKISVATKAGITDEVRKRMSASSRASWANPKSKQRTTVRILSRDALQSKSDKMRSHWSDPAYKANHSAKIKAAWARRKAISAPD